MKRLRGARAIIIGVLGGLLWVMAPLPAPAEPHHIGMQHRTFSPETLTIKVGDTVDWVNNDTDVHIVVSGKDLNDPDVGKPLDSGTLLPNQHYKYTFTKPGRYPYMCVIHWSLQSITGRGGMLGEVVVEP